MFGEAVSAAMIINIGFQSFGQVIKRVAKNPDFGHKRVTNFSGSTLPPPPPAPIP